MHPSNLESEIIKTLFRNSLFTCEQIGIILFCVFNICSVNIKPWKYVLFECNTVCFVFFAEYLQIMAFVSKFLYSLTIFVEVQTFWHTKQANYLENMFAWREEKYNFHVLTPDAFGYSGFINKQDIREEKCSKLYAQYQGDSIWNLHQSILSICYLARLECSKIGIWYFKDNPWFTLNRGEHCN